MRIEKERRGEEDEKQMMNFDNFKMMIYDDDKECSPDDHENQFMSEDQVQEHQSTIETYKAFHQKLANLSTRQGLKTGQVLKIS